MNICGVLGLIVAVLLFFRWRCKKRDEVKVPPSPGLRLPLLGHILHLRNARCPASLQRLRQTLGPLFTLHAGRTPIIFITSPSLAHHALIHHSLLFASRPLLPSRSLFTNTFHSINSAPYGPFWRSIRRNLVQHMLTPPRILSFAPSRRLVLDRMLSRIRAEAASNHGIVRAYPNLRFTMYELLLYMCFGFHMPEDALFQMSALIDDILIFSSGALTDFYSFLRIFSMRSQQRGRALRAKQVHLFTTYIEKHKELQKHGQVTPGSYLETLLHMNSSTPLSMDDLIALCTEILGAGADTTVSTLEWAMAHIVDNPSIQSKLYEQIRSVVGNQPVEEKDLPNLPYLQSIVKETLRLHPPGIFLLPHSVSEACKLGGYDIPANAVLLFQITSINKDPEVWQEATNFIPERFSNIDVDITGSREISMMPFGAGRRICPGLGLACLHMELFVARLVQSFEWTVFPAGATLDLTEKRISTIRLKHSLRAFVKEREDSNDGN